MNGRSTQTFLAGIFRAHHTLYDRHVLNDYPESSRDMARLTTIVSVLTQRYGTEQVQAALRQSWKEWVPPTK